MNQESINDVRPTGSKNLKITLIALGSIVGALILGVIGYVAVFKFLYQSSVSVKDQVVGDKIIVEKAGIKKGSFIVIYARGRFGAPGIRVAQTEYLIPDTYTDFSMNLITSYQVEGSPQRIDLQPGDRMAAIVYEDTNGDQRPDPAIDRPARSLFGGPVSADFTLR